MLISHILPLPGLAPLSDSFASDQVCRAIGRTGAIVGGREHTLVTKLPINLPFWEAAAEHTSFNLCTTFLHFTDKAKENVVKADAKCDSGQTAAELAEARGNYTDR